MNSSMTFFKHIALIFFISSGIARADLTDVKKSFLLECKGSEGSVYFKKTPEGIDYDISVKDVSLQGFMHTYLVTPTGSEQSSAAIIEPVYQANAKWLSVSVLESVKVYHGPSQGCKLTRNDQAPCQPITIPAGYNNVPKKWYSIMVDVSGSGQPKFMSLDLVKPYFKTLGPDTTCSINYL